MVRFYLFSLVLPVFMMANTKNSPYLNDSTRVLFSGDLSNRSNNQRVSDSRERVKKVRDKENKVDDNQTAQIDRENREFDLLFLSASAYFNKALTGEDSIQNLILAYDKLIEVFKLFEKDGKYPDQRSIHLFFRLREYSPCMVTKISKPRGKNVTFGQPGGDDLFYSPSSEVSYSVSPRSRISWVVTPPGSETRLTPVTPSPSVIRVSRVGARKGSIARTLNFGLGNSPDEDLELSKLPRIYKSKIYEPRIYWAIWEKLSMRGQFELFSDPEENQESALKTLMLAPLA